MPIVNLKKLMLKVPNTGTSSLVVEVENPNSVRIKLWADCVDTNGNPSPDPMTCANFRKISQVGTDQVWEYNSISFEGDALGAVYKYQILATNQGELADFKTFEVEAEEAEVPTP